MIDRKLLHELASVTVRLHVHYYGFRQSMDKPIEILPESSGEFTMVHPRRRTTADYFEMLKHVGPPQTLRRQVEGL